MRHTMHCRQNVVVYVRAQRLVLLARDDESPDETVNTYTHTINQS
jgi:hypothetical protein